MMNKYIYLLIIPLIIIHTSNAWNALPKKELDGSQYALGIGYATFFKNERLHRQIKKTHIASKFNHNQDAYIDGNSSSLPRPIKNPIPLSTISNKTDRQSLIETSASPQQDQSAQIQLTPEQIKALEQQIAETHAMANQSLIVDREVIEIYKSANLILQEKNIAYVGIIKSQQNELNRYKSLLYLSVTVAVIGFAALTTFMASHAEEQHLIASEAVKGWAKERIINETLIAALEAVKKGK